MYICRILLIQLLGCHIEINACLDCCKSLSLIDGISWTSGQLELPASMLSRGGRLSKIKETRMGFFMD